jgi:segregation and condensation protein B
MADEPRPQNLKAAIESILFVADEPVELSALARITGVPQDDVARAVDELSAGYHDRGVRIQRTASAVQMVTAPESAVYVQRWLGVDERQRLSPTVLAVLTVIAYKQPITRADTEKLLGKSCDYALLTLRARDLIAEVGRAPGPGRPYLYGTTFKFLEHFGLEKPEDLPPLPELESPRVPANPDPAAEPPAAEED